MRSARRRRLERWPWSRGTAGDPSSKPRSSQPGGSADRVEPLLLGLLQLVFQPVLLAPALEGVLGVTRRDRVAQDLPGGCQFVAKGVDLGGRVKALKVAARQRQPGGGARGPAHGR